MRVPMEGDEIDQIEQDMDKLSKAMELWHDEIPDQVDHAARGLLEELELFLEHAEDAGWTRKIQSEE